MRARVLSALLALVACLVAVPGQALAGDEDPYTRLLDAGFDAFEARDFKGALDLFGQAAEVRRTGEVMFNIAACHEYLGNLEEAVAALKESIQLGISAGLQERAQRKIEILEQRLAPADPDPIEEPAEPADPADPADPAEPAGHADDEWHGKRKTLQGLGGGLLGGGAAAVAAGGVLWGLAWNQNVQFEEAEDLETKQQHMAAVGDLALAGDIAAGVGAGVAISGLVISLVGCRCEAPGAAGDAVALYPAVLPLPEGGVAFVVGGEF